MKNLSNRILLLLLSLFILMAVWIAWNRGLTATLEAETAGTAREFLKNYNWTVNHLNGAEDYDKPPLFFWITAFFKTVSGADWEFAIRIPSLLSVVVIFFLFQNLEKTYISMEKGNKEISISLVASLIFLTTQKIFWMSQIARMDMFFSMLCFAALTSFFIWHEGQKKETEAKPCKYNKPYYSFFIISALAIMTKGPVALLILVPVILTFMIMQNGWKYSLTFWIGPGTLLMLLLSLPWFVIASVSTDGKFFYRFILQENLSRFGNIFSSIEYKEFKKAPISRYPIYLLTGFFPWSLLIPFTLWEKLKHFKITDSLSQLLIIYASWIFLFFSTCGVKRSDYIMPIYPALSFLTAHYT